MRNLYENGERWCGLCKKYHPTKMFGKNKANPDGLASRCKLGLLKKSAYEVELDQKKRDRAHFEQEYPDAKLGRKYVYELPDAYDYYIASVRKFGIGILTK